MNKFNEVFPSVYCINLNKDTQRYNNMIKVFNYLDINPIRWTATTPDVFTHLSKSLNLLSPNYLACLTSHLTAIRDAFDKGLETIFIVEDDIIPHKDFHNLFNLFYQEVVEWDFLYLSYIRLTDDCMYWTYSDAEEDLISPRVIKAKNFWSGMAYGLNRKAMENILTYYNNNKLIEIDRYYVELLQKNEDIKSIGSFPQLFAGLDNYSNNTNIFTEIFTRSANPKYLRREDFLDI